jgi:hypothetical protein
MKDPELYENLFQCKIRTKNDVVYLAYNKSIHLYSVRKTLI